MRETDRETDSGGDRGLKKVGETVSGGGGRKRKECGGGWSRKKKK